MADQEIVKSADGCSIPKWGPKKGLRYEVDDFIVSPPSNEDGGFFHLRYGQRSSPRTSTCERINEELSMTVEIKDGDPMISDINLSGSVDAVITTPPLNVTPTGLSPTKSPDSTPEVSSSHSTKPLFVFHLKDSKAGGTEDLVNQIDVATDAMTQVSLDTAESNLVHDNKCDRSGELSEEQLKKKKNQQLLLSKLNILDKVHTLPVTSPVDGIRSITPQLTPSSTPRSTPRTTPLASPILKRKVAGVVMEHNASHSYFCTKPYQNSQQSDTSPQSGSGELALSTTSTQMTQQLESASKVAMAMEAGQKLGKKRRPKPSSLREMNFWAPTSM